jgi:ABC-type glycerol-3-phosphate transport system substrate-binding protein
MKRKFLNQLIAVGATATMVASLAGCGETAQAPAPAPENNGQESGGEAGGQEGGGEEESPYEVYTDADGNPIDLGGIEVDIVNWWAADPADPVNDYEEEMWKYREWCEETYNFTVKETKTFAGEELTWGDCISQFTNYVTSGGDDNYYVFTSRWFSGATTAANSGLMYDLADLDCLDFKNNPIFTRNQVDEFYTYGDSTYCMYATSNGFSEPREGIYFNKRVLKDAGIDPESIYDMQANGTWTWDAWKEMCEKVHRDTNNDGTPDIYGFTGNYDDMSEEFVLSNGGSLIKQENGKYRVAFEDAEVQEALNFFQEMTSTYDAHLYFPKDAAWDFYKTDWLTGNCAFYVGQQWERDNVRGIDGDNRSMEDEVGFVTFPVGPSAGSNYGTYAGDNLYFIPACYDHDKAWKCAFAYMLFYADTPGYEDFIESLDGIKAANYSHFDDTRAVDETLVRIIKTSTYEPAEGVLNVDAGPDFRHHIGVNVAEGTMYDMAAQIEATTTMWDTYVEEANNK